MRKVFILTIGMFALGFDAYVMAGLLPGMEKDFHISNSQAGQTVSIFTLCYALAAPIFATLLAGKPARNILLSALVLFSIANGASAFAPNFFFLLLWRGAAGIGAGLYSPLAASAAASLVSNEKRGRALGMTIGGMSIGTVAGVPLGLIMAEHIGWNGTLWLIALVGTIGLLSIFIWFPDIPASVPPTLRERAAMLADFQVTRTILVTFLTSIASLGLYTYVASILESQVNMVATYLWVWGIGGVIGSFSIGYWLDRTGKPSLLMAIILLFIAVAMFSLPFTIRSPLLSFVPFLIWGAAGWASQTPQQQVLLQIRPDHGATAVALNSSANYLGSSVGSTLGGVLMLNGVTPAQLPIAAGILISLVLLGQISILLKSQREVVR